MSYKPLRMHDIKKILLYHRQGIPKKKIARLLGLSKNTVKKYINKAAGVEDIDNEDQIGKCLSSTGSSEEERKSKDLEGRCSYLIEELGRVGVTRYLLWEEYIKSNPSGYSYSSFCRKLSAYKSRQDVTIRIEHKAAYKLSVDYTGKKVAWVDKSTGEEHRAEVLVCTMPYSNYTFACAVGSQKQEDFIYAINQALLYLGGLPKVLESDNLKSYVKKADRYEPTFTELCVQLSTHYGVELEATRVGKPKDKANVERHVGIVYNKLYAPLRDKVFHSLDEINAAFRVQLDKMNTKPLQGKNYSRYDKFTSDEKPHLSPLPSSLFEIKKSTRGKVQRNYHVILGEDKHQYSVPYQHVGKTTDVIYTSKTVEIYLGTQRIAVHKRDRRKHAYSTLPIHMPEKHKKYLDQKGWDATYFKKQATLIGPHTQWAIDTLLESKQWIEQTYNSCLGLLSLKKKYGADRLENACAKAHTTHRISYGYIRTILQNNMDKAPEKEETNLFSYQEEENIRGANHYS